MEMANPVRHAEVTKNDNGNNVTPSHFAEGQVGELPIIAPRPQKGAVDRRPVSQIIKTDVMEQVKIITPAAIMVTRLHLIDPGFAIVDCGDAVFDPGKIGRASCRERGCQNV